jgi:hypothetical protein
MLLMEVSIRGKAALSLKTSFRLRFPPFTAPLFGSNHEPKFEFFQKPLVPPITILLGTIELPKLNEKVNGESLPHGKSLN